MSGQLVPSGALHTCLEPAAGESAADVAACDVAQVADSDDELAGVDVDQVPGRTDRTPGRVVHVAPERCSGLVALR